MKIIKRLILIIVLNLILSACIDRYYLNESENYSPAIVIEGTLTNQDGEQEITVSWSSSFEKPVFNGVSGCNVIIEDDQKNQFHLTEDINNPGHYLGVVPDYYIIIGSKYRVIVRTPDEKEYASTFETMNPCPPIDSIYYEKEIQESDDPNISMEGVGIQFYVNLNADDTYNNYFRWDVEETYEYHSFFPITKYIDDDGVFHDNDNPDYSYYYCYHTRTIEDIYVLSTSGLTSNRYRRFPLNYVDNDASQRLYHHYSLLLKQYSLSESAYNFWRDLKKNNKDQDNILGKLPAWVRSNIYNVNDTTEVVLGFFGVSAVNEKRIHIHGVPGFRRNHPTQCSGGPEPFPAPEDMTPLYYAEGEDQLQKRFLGWTFETCVICTTHGGTIEKPSFWNEE